MHLTTYLIHELDISQRRVFSSAEAASYVGVSKGHFSNLVNAGTMPKPLPGYGRARRWDKTAIDQALDKMGGVVKSSPELLGAYDEWKRASSGEN